MTTFEHITKWTRPQYYIGAEWDGWYRFLGQNRDSDTLTRSNFTCGLELVKSASGGKEIEDGGEMLATVQVVRESHWACGWVEWIAIHDSDTDALQEADRIMEKIDGYPVVDEDHWSQLEDEAAQEVWRNCYSDRERLEYIRRHNSQFEFSDFADLMGCVRGKYFCGYAGELLAR